MAAASEKIDAPNRPKDGPVPVPSVNRTDLSAANLTPDEHRQLLAVMKKAQEFEVSEERQLLRQPLEGQLCKYTNVVTGWQYRWFVLNPELGKLEYFEKEEHKKQRPRGYLSLAGAVVIPSDEDEQTFTVNAAQNIYRLKAADARERQHWVNRLRATAEHYAPPPTYDTAISFTELSAQHDKDGTVAGSNLSTSPSQRGSQLDNATATGHTSRPVASLHNHGGEGRGRDGSTSSEKGMRRGEPGKQGARSSGSRHKDVPGGELVNSARKHAEQRAKSSERSRQSSAVDVVASSKKSSARAPQVSEATLSAAVDSSDAMTVEHSLINCTEQLLNVEKNMCNMSNKIEALPVNSEYIGSLDKEMLLLKATSGAMLSCLQQCLVLLQQQACIPNSYPMNSQYLNNSTMFSSYNQSSRSPTPTRHSTRAPMDITPVYSRSSHDRSIISDDTDDGEDDGLVNACVEADTEDAEIYVDTELDGIEEHKNIILHVLSQLKLGMDLTKVVLPTFILEKRSLLEMFADCMAHPQLFLSIPHMKTAEERMLAVLEWYLTSFHAGRQGCVAKKPYNPIIGEHFHCSWRVRSRMSRQSSRSRTESGGVVESGPRRSQTGSPQGSGAGPQLSQGPIVGEDESILYYCAEQVSHHPPVSAFYFESPDHQICMEGSIWTRSKFMGMSIGVMMVGKLRLKLVDIGEEYELSLPSAYARSILTVPWVELGDKVNLQCDSTGYSASVVFHTKPFYGGKLHRITSEVRNPTAEVICRVTGEWNGVLEFKYSSGATKLVDTSELAILSKCVRPLSRQTSMESRKLWQHVTENLKSGDIDKATEHKQELEEQQRQGERRRNERKIPFPTKYFKRDGDEWVFKNRLTPSMHRS